MGAKVVAHIKLSPYYISLAVYCVVVFFLCGALRTASIEIRESAAIEATVDTYIKQELVQIVSMRI